MASALPVIVGVESLVVVDEVAKEVGASGAVVSEDELEPDPELPETGDFPANVSIGISRMKPNEDIKNNNL